MMKQKENKLHSDKPSLSCLKYFFPLSFSHHSSLYLDGDPGGGPAASPPLRSYCTLPSSNKQ